MNIPEIQDELLRLEYPFLLPDHDPDIERYYYLRNNGRYPDAMKIFEARLKPRYPDDDFRTWLLRCYRSRDPAFRPLLARGYRALGERLLNRIRRIIAFIADKADSYNPRDMYSTIKTAEDIRAFLPGDRYEAIAGIERYLRYAEVLALRPRSLAMAVELMRSFLTDSLDVVERERRRRQQLRRRKMEQEYRQRVKADWDSYQWQKKHGGAGAGLIDFSGVVFSPEDLARIEIPRSCVKIEDQTLAYCVKYWNLINDNTFERILFLYSRKHGTKNYDILLMIRRGRQSKKRDEEILASIMSCLVTGYYYSIRGDRTLQQRWNAIKASVEKSVQAAPFTLPTLKTGSPAPAPKAAPPKRALAKKPAARTEPVRLPPKSPAKSPAEIPGKAPASTHVPKKAPVRAPAKAVKKVPTKAPPEAPARVKTPVQARAAPSGPNGKAPVTEILTGKVKKAAKKRLRIPQPVPAAGKPGGSVSDRLRKLSGRSYDVYQDRFLAKARPAIRKIMGAGRGIFYTLPEKTEDLIFNFLKNHYSDPYMNWEESRERDELRGMGFELESMDPIIVECYRKL